MNIVVLCATNRGLLFLKRLFTLLPESKLTIFTFEETIYEPAFVEDISNYANEIGATLFSTKVENGRLIILA